MGLDVWRSSSYVHFLFYVLPFCSVVFCVQKRIKTESKTFYITPTHNKRDYRTEFCDFSRQGVVSILAIILNHTLYSYGGEHSIAVYGIISRMLMFALFPILGITQGLFQLLVIITELKIMKGSRKVSKFLSNMQRC
jgi:Na+-driven multidrug efflux pump